MINKKQYVPNNTISIIVSESDKKVYSNINNIIEKPDKKRDWFTSHFYRCLPLTIGNQYGFILKTEYPFAFEWDGGEDPESTKLYFPKNIDNFYPRVETHFGHGIITINPPFTLRTPPGINLITINPPNYIIPNITFMTGVIETDNLRRNFSFNLKIQMPNILTEIPAGSPVGAFIPIPRYFADSFSLNFAKDIFDEDSYNSEIQAINDASEYRKNVEPNLPGNVGRHYLLGTDVYGNKFLDHQGP